VFAVNLKHVADLVHEFRAAGVDARSVSAHTDLKERKETIAAFGAGEFPVLINCQVLTEGTDIPQVGSQTMARV
jgi:ATP-dependent helicase IRC3